MLDYSAKFRQLRSLLGLSQVELAHLSGISLPTVQNMEGGSGNPSIETLTAIGGILGLEMNFCIKKADWDRFAFFGAPLTRNGKNRVENQSLTEDGLVHCIREACVELYLSKTSEGRNFEATQAVLLALRDHFPEIFNKHFRRAELIKSFLPEELTGRIIKLRRIALSQIAEYL